MLISSGVLSSSVFEAQMKVLLETKIVMMENIIDMIGSSISVPGLK